ncbi:immunoglobulin-like and fibronectin type III domain-containing protein 1.1 isoform X3 [Tachysurus fulvidraco]|uniref:immunoglobulin-like and fibronectin type III domain-containing protein 1.1 isoform X3 n=1 Tax=Tachysurus fulvidraco TaxID=1234273 RepID=UPI001FF03E48|nr:immunoglobulin-like and fibronectin type III domain-containing protein 1.1 isoform X3 [Tachysurus fulvidraco]
MWKKSKVTDQTATGQGGIKRRSKVPGVMITQYVDEIPEGKSTPDYKRKPIALTIQEGKLAIFKAIVIGEPKPTVSWKRAKGEMNDPEKFQNKYDPVTNEHTLEIPRVSGEEADTYKCYAVNEYGKAVCPVVLNVIEVGFKKSKELKKTEEMEDPAEFRNKLRRSAGKAIAEKKEGDIDESVWDLLLSADKKDYERICFEYGITDFRGMLKKLTELKKQREQEQALFVQQISNLKHIEVKSANSAVFELDIELKDPNSRIFLYKDGIMVPYSKDLDNELKHYLKQVGKKYVFTVKNLTPEDAGIYQVDVEGVNIFSTDFKIPSVDFLVKIQEVKAEEREDAIFECVTSLPMNHILWTLKNNPLSNCDKYEITVSEDKLIHRLKVIDCMPVDAGIYSAVAGIKSCSAWLVVESNKDSTMKGKKIARKTTQAGGSGVDLTKIASEQQEKYKKEMEEAMELAKRAKAERDAAAAKAKAEAEAALAASRAAAAAKAAAAAEAAEAALAAAKAKGMSQKDAKAQADAAAAAAAAKAQAEAEANARKLAEAKAKEAGLSAEDIAKAGAAASAMLTQNIATAEGLVLDGAGMGDAEGAGPGGSANLAGGAHAAGGVGPALGSVLAGGVGDDNGAGSVDQAGVDTLLKEGADAGAKSKKHARTEVAITAKVTVPEANSTEIAPVEQIGQQEQSMEQPKQVAKEQTDEQPNQAKKQSRVRQGSLMPDTVIVGGNPHGNPGSNPGHNPSGNPGHNPSGNPGHKTSGNPGHNPSGNPGHNPSGNPGHKTSGNPGHNPSGNPGHNPSGNPGHNPGHNPSGNPGHNPSGNPGHNPSGNPGHKQGSNPGHNPSDNPGHNPSGNPDGNPDGNPSGNPGDNPSGNPGGNGAKPEGNEGAPPDGEATEGTKDGSAEADKHSGQTRQGPLLPEEPTDPGVYISAALEDCSAIVGEAAELVCKLSSADCKGLWYRDGKEISDSTEGITISKDGVTHKLKIHKVSEEFAGKYKFEADGRKTEAMIIVEDPPRFATKDLEEFSKPRVVKANQKAEFKIPYIGREATKIQWYKEGVELAKDTNCKIETTESHCRLSLSKLQRKESGEIKIKIKNEFGTVEAISNLIVLDKPTPPLGPLEIVDASSNSIEFKWRPPKDDGGCPVTHYILERNQVGRNKWKKIGQIPGEAHYRDTDVDHGRRYCYRIRAETSEGISEVMETEDVQAGTKAYPGPPSTPKVISAFKDCITLSWTPPANTGGTNILGYNLEKRKKGSNLWGLVHPPEEPIKTKKYPCNDVIEGMEYEFRVTAINISGAGEPSLPSETVFARDPKKPPGKVIDLKVTGSTYNTLSISWTKPKEVKDEHDEAKGYFVEIRPAESIEWNRCNTNATIINFYTVKGLKSLAIYWVRVIAVNEGGAGEPTELNNYIIATPPPVRPKFTDANIKSFMVVKAGNSGRFNVRFVASPWPEIIWLKDGTPVSKRVTVTNTEGSSQILILSAERSDSGIYTIVLKNFVGQESFTVEIRVTDEPKPPGPVELDMNVQGTVTISWGASPDEKRDDHLNYMVTKRDSVKQTWDTVADGIFNNRFTVCNVLPGREYQFRVYAKNDMGKSVPSESPKWLITEKKEKYILTLPESKTCNLDRPPKFPVPLKLHTAPQGYECYMSCAVRGNPTPYVTWYRNNVSLNSDSNYYITNTCGVCSMLILRVTPKDTGVYKVIAENPLGRAECSTKLVVRE